MDAVKTGAMIADARKEKGMTQRQLAQLLHISDRTVSKWERGVGFPDVSLLEPLSDALGLTVTALLRGEATQSVDDGDVRLAVRSIRRAMLQKLRKNLVAILGWGILLGLLGLIISQAFEDSWLFSKEIYHELSAGVYIDGQRVADTDVVIDGRRHSFGRGRFNGRFAIEYVEETCREETVARVDWHKDDDHPGVVSMSYFGYGQYDFVDMDWYVYMSPTMESFAIEFAGGVIIATSDNLAQLIALDWYYPLASNTTYSHS